MRNIGNVQESRRKKIKRGKEMAAELTLTPYEIKDDSGKVLKGNTYGVRSVDEDGQLYECKIKPFRDSDKALLNMLLR